MTEFSKGKIKLWPISAKRPKKADDGPNGPSFGRAHFGPLSLWVVFFIYIIFSKKITNSLICCHLNWPFINLNYDLFGNNFYLLMNFPDPIFRPYFWNFSFFGSVKVGQIGRRKIRPSIKCQYIKNI